MSEASSTHYAVLGVSPTATMAEIRQAFRRLARQYHPDVNPNNPRALETFQRVNTAYHVLIDPAMRQHYDQSLRGDGASPAWTVPSHSSAVDAYQHGLTLSLQQRYQEAIQQFTQALEQNTEWVDAYNHRGYAYYKLNRSAEAFADYARAIRLDNAQATSYYYRGLNRFKQGYTEAAIADFTQAIAIESDHAQAYYHRALAHHDVNEPDHAIQDMGIAEQYFRTRGDRPRADEATAMLRQWQTLAISPMAILHGAMLTCGDTGMTLLRLIRHPHTGVVDAFDHLSPARALRVTAFLILMTGGGFSLMMGDRPWQVFLTVGLLLIGIVLVLGMMLSRNTWTVGNPDNPLSPWLKGWFLAATATTPLIPMFLALTSLPTGPAVLIILVGSIYTGRILDGGYRYLLRIRHAAILSGITAVASSLIVSRSFFQ